MSDGYSITHPDFSDDKTANIQIRSDSTLTWRKLINGLRDLADQLEGEHKDDGEECYQ